MVETNNKRKLEKVIVTGATGFIGYALVEKLVSEHVKVYAIVRGNSNQIEKLYKLNGVEIIYCELSEVRKLKELLPQQGYDTFFHFAWQGVSNQDAKDLDVQLMNVKYACEAVKVAKALGCKHFIFAASIMEYEVMKLMETSLEVDQRNIYRTAKIAAHYMTRIVANSLSINYNAAIISNVFGRGEISNRFINSTLRKMLKGERTQYTKATQLYDFVYILDAVEMLQLIAEKGIANKNYYIGSMQPQVLKEYIYAIRNCVDEKLPLGIGENKEYVGVSLNYEEIDIYACRDDFGFEPKYTFEEGILQTIKWIQEMEKKYEDSKCCSSYI